MRLFYDAPAKKWEEALPVGNGRLGAMALMDPDREIVFLNEDSIWSGKPMNRINPDAKEYLPQVRSLLREGKIREAERLSLFALSGTPNSERSYETAGELQIGFENRGKYRNYSRELDLETGIVTARYEIDGTGYTRQMFASYPKQAVFMSFEADGEGTVDCSMRFERCHNRLDEVYGKGNEIGFRVDRPEGISFAVKVRAVVSEGSVHTIGEHLLIEGAKKAYLCIAIETSFRHEDYEKAAAERLDTLFEDAKKLQISDYFFLKQRRQSSCKSAGNLEQFSYTALGFQVYNKHQY